MTEEQRKQMIDLYNEGKAYTQIEKIIHVCRKNIAKEINKLIDDGEIKKRNKPHPNFKEISKNTQTIMAMYNDGAKFQDIAKTVGCSLSNVSHVVNRLKASGAIQERKKPYVKKPKHIIKKNVRNDIVMNKKPVKCNSNLSRTCIYGYESHCEALGKCNFLSCTGRSRNSMSPKGAHVPTEKSDYTDCYFYQKIEKGNPRRKSLDGFNFSEGAK